MLQDYLSCSPDKRLCDIQHVRVLREFNQVFPQLLLVFIYFSQFCLQLLQLFLLHKIKVTQNQVWKLGEDSFEVHVNLAELLVFQIPKCNKCYYSVYQRLLHTEYA